MHILLVINALYCSCSLILPYPIFLPETFDSVSVLFLHGGTILGRYHCSWTEVFLKVNFKD